MDEAETMAWIDKDNRFHAIEESIKQTNTYVKRDYNAVLWAVEKRITAGTSAIKFSPDASCTRAQIVTFLHRAYG